MRSVPSNICAFSFALCIYTLLFPFLFVRSLKLFTSRLPHCPLKRKLFFSSLKEKGRRRVLRLVCDCGFLAHQFVVVIIGNSVDVLWIFGVCPHGVLQLRTHPPTYLLLLPLFCSSHYHRYYCPFSRSCSIFFFYFSNTLLLRQKRTRRE